MIIRRKHTADFTVMGNAVFNDERLMADELGILCFLRSRPHDWEVRRPALRRRFKIGRDGMRRIIRNLIRFGWIVSEVTRLDQGRVFIIYTVRDEPGPELSDEEAKAALSLVSSGADQGSVEDDDGEGEGTDETDASGADPPDGVPVTDGPVTGGGKPPPVSRPPPYKTLQNTDSVKTESTKRVRDFADVKIVWPAENILSESASMAAFLSLSDKDKEDCFAGLRPYLDDCHKQGRKICDLRTFIQERRWERFAKPKDEKPKLYVAKLGTAQFWRWLDYRVANGEDRNRLMQIAERYGGFATETEWPPSNLEKTG